MEASYDPQAVESRWYQVWEDAGVFKPEINPDGEPFSIVIPPPNVTGVLHIGHALNMSIQDVIIRRKRMQGYAALWLPGTDHAGIATQNVVERELAKEDTAEVIENLETRGYHLQLQDDELIEEMLARKAIN